MDDLRAFEKGYSAVVEFRCPDFGSIDPAFVSLRPYTPGERDINGSDSLLMLKAKKSDLFSFEGEVNTEFTLQVDEIEMDVVYIARRIGGIRTNVRWDSQD